METLSIIDERVKQPLSDASSKTKKSLLRISFFGIAITELGFMPSKISLLGITLESGNQVTILIITLLAVIYSLISFFISIMSDLLAWKVMFFVAKEDLLLSLDKFDISHLNREMVLAHLKDESKLTNQTKWMFITRIIIDIVTPIVFSLTAIYLVGVNIQ